jgi:hypothetical protein
MWPQNPAILDQLSEKQWRESEAGIKKARR